MNETSLPYVRKIGVLLLSFLACLIPLAAQAQFSPVNPPEPGQVYSYRLTVDSEPANCAWNSGAGKYVEGEQLWVNTSPCSSSYHFSHWTLNGEKMDGTPMGFLFTMPAKAVHLVAHYIFNPESPQEPEAHLFRRLTLVASPQGVASFNRSAESRVERYTQVELDVYANQGYRFLGWYDAKGNCLAKSSLYYWQMPDADAMLTARFCYSPVSPANPQGGQGDVLSYIPGDANYDGLVDMTDAQLILNVYLSGESPDADVLKVCDTNGDRMVDITDVSLVVSKVMNKKK